ncbi:MAG: YihY/virulence factor BrkB family protein [Pseudomonadota bacterium]
MPIATVQRGVWPILKELGRRYSKDQVSVLAGYIAYSAMLAGLPFMIFATALAGIIIDETYTDRAIALLFETAPEHVARTFEPVLREVLGRERSGVLTLSILGTLYAASNGCDAIRIGLDRAYDVESTRGFLRNRLVAIGFVLIGFLTFAVLTVLIVFAPLMFRLLDEWTPIEITTNTVAVRYLIGAAVLYGFLWINHRFLPSRQMKGMRLWPGILASVLLWGLIASAMSVYLAFAPDYSLTYGALAGVIVTLLFFFLTGNAILLGAEINAALNFEAPPDGSGSAVRPDEERNEKHGE